MQEDVWNDLVGQAWAAHVEELDRAHEPFTTALFERAGDVSGRRVLDVGCGCGSTTLALAARGAEAVGIDLSRPMIDVATSRAGGTGVQFTVADASAWRPSGDAAFDLVVSQFGWMFFPDPAGAIAHLRSLTRPGARFLGLAWQEVGRNPWMTTPVFASIDALGPPELPGPEQPGPFAFADPVRTRSVLEGAGWAVRAVDAVEADVTWGRDAAASAEAALAYNPIVAAGVARSPERRDDALAAITASFREHERDGLVWFPAAAWLVEGEHPGS